MQTRRLADFTTRSEEKLAKHGLFATERLLLDTYCLLPGQAQRPHVHEGSDKVYVVLEGTCRFRVGESEAEHGPGTCVLAPAGSSHGVENPGPHPARLLVMMTPPPARSA